MPQIQNASLVRKIERAFQLRGAPGPGTLSPEIVPVSIVHQLGTDATELRQAANAYSVSGDADEYPFIQLIVPSGSEIIAEHFRLVVASPGTNQQLVVRSYNAAVGTYDAAEFVDTRVSGIPATQLRHGKHTSIYGAANSAIVDVLSTTAVEIELPYVLKENKGFVVSGVTLNTTLSVTAFWTERAEQPED